MARPRLGHDVFLRGRARRAARSSRSRSTSSAFTSCCGLTARAAAAPHAGADDRAFGVSVDGRGIAALGALSRPCAGLARTDELSAAGGARRAVPPIGARRDLCRRHSSWCATAASSCARTGPSGRSICAARRRPAGGAGGERAGAAACASLEALLFASAEPLDEATLARHLDEAADVAGAACASSPKAMPGAASTSCGSPAAGRFAPHPISPPDCASSEGSTRKLSRAAVETARRHRLPPAGDPRRDRGNPRGGARQRHDRHADAKPAGSVPRVGAPAPAARSSGRRPRTSSRISAWTPWPSCRASTSCAPPASSTLARRWTASMRGRRTKSPNG